MRAYFQLRNGFEATPTMARRYHRVARIIPVEVRSGKRRYKYFLYH
jgi:hypothetical protein